MQRHRIADMRAALEHVEALTELTEDVSESLESQIEAVRLTLLRLLRDAERNQLEAWQRAAALEGGPPVAVSRAWYQRPVEE